MRLAKIVTTLAAAAVLGACAAAPSGLAADGRLDRDDLVGTWQNAEGTTVRCTSGMRHTYIVRINDNKDYLVMSMHPLGAKLVGETVLDRGKDAPPVFMYEMFDIDVNEVTTRTLSDAWLEAKAKNNDTITFVRMEAEEGEPPHGVMGSDAAGLRAMLLDAVNDPSAWKEPVLWKRVN